MSDEKYVLPCVEDNFQSRSRDIFTCLDTIEDKHTAFNKVLESKNAKREKSDDEDDDEAKNTPNLSHHKQLKTSDKGKRDAQNPVFFRRPQFSALRRGGQFKNRAIPDFKKHPEKWAKYDLSDVTAEDMSESSNASAAFGFLTELRKRKQLETESSSKELYSTKPVFVKRDKTDSDETGESKPTTTRGIIVMPEYEIGKSSKVKPKKSATKTESSISSQVQLDHLVECEEDLNTPVSSAGTVAFKKRKGNQRSVRKRADFEEEDISTE